MNAHDNLVLQIKNVSKSFGSVRALKDVSLNLYRGKVMGLIGENGAGKSTIIKCITGIHSMDSGDLHVDGIAYEFKHVKDSVKAGIAVVHQELKLAENMSVAENIFLGRPISKMGVVNHKKMFEEADKLLEQLNVSFNSKVIVNDLTIAEQQMIEIAKALSLNSNIIILDEPTDALSDKETVALFNVIKKLKKEGKSFLYVTHRMKEIHEICDDVSIFKDGVFIDEMKSNETTIEKMVSKMIGRDLNEQFPKRDIKLTGNEYAFEMNNITNHLVRDITIKVKSGEIVGLAGLVGSGRTEFVKTVIGFYGKTAGSVLHNGKVLKIRNIRDSISHNIFYVTENRKLDGVILDASIKDNMIEASLKKYTNKIGIINNGKIDIDIQKQRESMSLRMNSFSDPISSLSGGNQQKVLLSKALLTMPKLLILDEPTRGVDVGARKEIYQIINKICAEGTSIIMISSEMPEVIGLSDRIGVFHEGKLSGMLENKKSFTEENIMKLATGLKVKEK